MRRNEGCGCQRRARLASVMTREDRYLTLTQLHLPLYYVLFRHVSSPGDDRVLARASCACPISPSVLTAISSDRDVSVVVSMLPTPDVQRQHSTGLHLTGGLRIYSVNSSDDLYDATLRLRGRVRDENLEIGHSSSQRACTWKQTY
jgi:hypothetical protein